jgi:hypothetical protein
MKEQFECLSTINCKARIFDYDSYLILHTSTYTTLKRHSFNSSRTMDATIL